MKNISFVIPAYNASTTIEETVESIFNLNFFNGDEIIIVNDCSTDNTIEILNKLQQKYPMINIVHNLKNVGCPASRNIGIKIARNELIISLDSDNILAKNSIEILKKDIIENDADIVTFGSIKFFEKNIKLVTHKWVFKKGWLTLQDVFSGNFNPAPVGNYLFTKNCWEKVGGFSELEKGLHEAWIFTLKQLLGGSKIFISSKGFYYHRYGHESLTIREYKKSGVEKRILDTIMLPNLNIFDSNESQHIRHNTPEWIHSLNDRPIRLKDANIGKNGKIVRTPYGILNSLIKIIKKCFLKK